MWLTRAKKPDARMIEDIQDMRERLHRLEIHHRQLQERFDDLQGRHESLSAQFRGRMGGRPPKTSAALTPVPVGAQHLFTHQEQR